MIALHKANSFSCVQYEAIAQKDSQSSLNFYLHNAHGDVTKLTDNTGSILNSYSYDAFGNTTSYTEQVENHFRYAGEQYDTISGKYYLRARYYDPVNGRFIQEDPYRGDGLNLYAYVSNNPVLCFLRGKAQKIHKQQQIGIKRPHPKC